MRSHSVRYTPQINDANGTNNSDPIESSEIQATRRNNDDIFYIRNNPQQPVILPSLAVDPQPVRREKFDAIQCILCTILTFLLISTAYITFTDPNGPLYGPNDKNFDYRTRPTGTTPSYLSNFTLPIQTNCGKPAVSPNQADTNVYNNKRRFSRIINGRTAIPHSWPWMVSLQNIRYESHFCDGFLIYEQFVITAAHCLEDKHKSTIRVVVGLHELQSFESSQIQYVEEMASHEMYDSVNILYDIGIIKLRNPVKLSDTVSTICLPNSVDDANSVYGMYAILAGWGRIDKGTKDVLATELQEAILKIKNGELPCSSREYDPRTVYCAIDTNKTEDANACNGDSGGPLFIKLSDTWYAYGITSYITGKSGKNDATICLSDHPSYYTKIPLYLNWIAWKMSTL